MIHCREILCTVRLKQEIGVRKEGLKKSIHFNPNPSARTTHSHQGLLENGTYTTQKRGILAIVDSMFRSKYHDNDVGYFSRQRR
jgi:hypothetical protein